MLVIRANEKTVDEAISKFTQLNRQFWVDYAAINTPDQTVVAGDSQNIEAFAKFCEHNSLKCIVLASTHAFHSRHMDPMLEAYRMKASAVKRLKIGRDAPKYISGMEGRLVEATSIDTDYWVRHTREKVSFIDACKAIQTEGNVIYLEVGPHPVLSAFVKMNSDSQSVTCLPSLRRGKEEWPIILESLGNLYLSDWKGEVNWKGFDRHYNRSRVNLPFYPFIRKPIWLPIQQTPKKIHPLLGKVFQNACEQTVFQNDLSTKSASFIPDHVIGNTVVFPGAGFLEMCLSGGFCTVQGLLEDFNIPQRPIAIQQLKIQSPLALSDSHIAPMQTIVSLETGEGDLGYKIQVFRHDNSGDSSGIGRWISHASARYLPAAPKLKAIATQTIDIKSIQSKWESSYHQRFYNHLPKVGLHFGKKFQSLGKSWKSEEGVLTKVQIPEDSSRYLIHPVVADAMIQSVMLWTSKGNLKKLHVPVQIGEFVWLSQIKSKSCYVYSGNDYGAKGKGCCRLVDETGEIVAFMGSVDFVETNVKLIESIIQQQSIALPQLWEEKWKNVPGTLQTNIAYEYIHTNNQLSPEQLKLWKEVDFVGENDEFYFKTISQLTEFSFLNVLYDLGWKPEVGKEFTARDLMSSLGIVKSNSNSGYCHWFLKKMSWSGYLTIFPEKKFLSKFHVTKLPPNKGEIVKFLKRTVTPFFVDRPPYSLIKEIGENLVPVLTGQSSGLSFLFPTDATKPSAEQFYKKLCVCLSKTFDIWIQNTLQMISNVIHESKTTKKIEMPTLRILEIGAGTGSFTENFLKSLSQFDIHFEYWYTDISGAFSKNADKKFEDIPEKLIFKKFNIEEDPMKQGLHPEYFDFIVAAEVLHIAKDMRKTLRNIRSILKPNGIFQAMEQTVQTPHVTFIFGLLEGYWQFQDYDIRPDHPTLSFPDWEKTLESTGFYNVWGMSVYHGYHSLINCHANLQPQWEIQSLRDSFEEKSSWIVFCGDTEITELLQNYLRSLNRKVVIVSKPKARIDENAANQLISKMFETATLGNCKLEGIVYLWGLSKDISERDQTLVSLPFLSVCQQLSKMEGNPPRMVVITHGLCRVNDNDEIINPVSAPLMGITKCMRNEYPHMNIFNLDLCPSKDAKHQTEEILANLWVANNASLYAIRNGKRLCFQFALTKIPNEYLTLPRGCDRFQLILPKTKVFADLEFGYLEPGELGDYEVEIRSNAMGLNFRDVFAVLKPTKEFERINSIGIEFAGVICKVGEKVTKWNVGDRVLGMNMNVDIALPSHIKLLENLIIKLPDHMTFSEATTFPTGFSTVYECLVTVAKMKKGETLLLHTASGGVGLCAIQLAKHFGVNIIATSGSARKRNYLHNLGIQHVFNSRTTEFGKQTLEATNGSGVDIVLNSLTGEGFKEASLGALATNGRFIEMSKLNIWQPEEVKALRPDVFYEIVDLTKLDDEKCIELFSKLKKFMDDNVIGPIAYETFDALNIRGALQYLQKAKHIGKIVCLMPKLKVKNSTVSVETQYYNEESTYVITGGLGGIGLEVAKYLLKNGAKHIAILSRREKPSLEVQKLIDNWNKCGKHVQHFSVDIGNTEEISKVFEDLSSPKLGFPQIRGVMHAAGVLSDNIVQKQTWSSFMHTFNPKINGTWNLHDLTKNLNLEHFVVFSSISAVLGLPGQSNHSASNCFQDSLTDYRRSNGLPSTTINWGNWGEVGVATEIDFPGLHPISTSQGILTLDTFLKTHRSHIAVMNVNSFAIMGKAFPLLKTLVADKRLLGETKTTSLINSDEFWKTVDAAKDRNEKMELFTSFLKTTVKNVLKFDDSEEVNGKTDFQVLGIDSLMMLEMKNGIQNVLGSQLSFTVDLLKDCTTTEALANKLVDIQEGKKSGDENISKDEK